jgi:hypothetical protein
LDTNQRAPVLPLEMTGERGGRVVYRLTTTLSGKYSATP